MLVTAGMKEIELGDCYYNQPGGCVRCLETEPVNYVVPDSLQPTTPLRDDVLMRFLVFT